MIRASIFKHHSVPLQLTALATHCQVNAVMPIHTLRPVIQKLAVFFVHKFGCVNIPVAVRGPLAGKPRRLQHQALAKYQ